MNIKHYYVNVAWELYFAVSKFIFFVCVWLVIGQSSQKRFILFSCLRLGFYLLLNKSLLLLFMYCLLLEMFLSEFLVQRREFIILPRAEMKNMSSALLVPLRFVLSAKLRAGEMMSPFFSTAVLKAKRAEVFALLQWDVCFHFQGALLLAMLIFKVQ